MVFACQQDSFLRELRTQVLSCKSSKLADKAAYEVVLEDTVLFPEGGGQVGRDYFAIWLDLYTVSYFIMRMKFLERENNGERNRYVPEIFPNKYMNVSMK